ncbi:Putative transport protein [hydrothermal vent metagenome]|uniref:Putative transport protein n=1 Tax=hydrothermal vent metagenome TaxID=652676 RepID=A0A1W1C5I7_9ZZZZ
MLGLFILFPVFSINAQYYENTTPVMIGLAIGIYGLTQAILQIPFGVLSDKFGRKPILLIGILFFIIGSIISALATDIMTVVIGRFFQGLGAISSVLMAFVADIVREEHRTKANAFIGMQIGIAFMVAILIAPIITNQIGINGLFWFITIIATIAFLIATTLPKQKIYKQYQFSLQTFKSILILPLLRLNFSIFVLHFILASTFISLPLQWVKNNISASQHWHIYLPVMIISFILMVPFIIAIEKYKKINLNFAISIMLVTLSSFMFYQYNTPLISFVFLTLFFTGFNTLEATIPSLIAKKISNNKRGLAMGFNGSSQFLGAFFGGLIGGIIFKNYSLNSVFLANSLLGICWLFFILFTQRSKDYGRGK